jgi:hypothetical protein
LLLSDLGWPNNSHGGGSASPPIAKEKKNEEGGFDHWWWVAEPPLWATGVVRPPPRVKEKKIKDGVLALGGGSTRVVQPP